MFFWHNSWLPLTENLFLDFIFLVMVASLVVMIGSAVVLTVNGFCECFLIFT